MDARSSELCPDKPHAVSVHGAGDFDRRRVVYLRGHPPGYGREWSFRGWHPDRKRALMKGATNARRNPKFKALLLRLGIIPPDTAFNRRAAAYAKKACNQEINLKDQREFRARRKASLPNIGGHGITPSHGQDQTNI